jgi:hypothetical protein
LVAASKDLSERIARLERLLDGLENARRARGLKGGESPSDEGQSALARLVDISALLQQRVTRADWAD